ncbi:MAG: SRPBCC domain-containing protein [Planctomycetota bacterium]
MPEVLTATTRRVFKIDINAPIEAVWKEITRTDAPILCFFNNRMSLSRGGLVPGSKIAMRSPDGKWTGVVGTIFVCEPPHRFGHTFRFTNLDDPECKVIYELKPGKSGGTEFTLIVEDLAVGTKTAKQMTDGGTMIINTLKSVMETGKATFGMRCLFGMIKVLGPVMTPKVCRSENWPVD